MIPNHTAAIAELPLTHAALLATKLREEGLLPDAPSDPEELANTLDEAGLTQAEIVLTLAADTSIEAIETVERLIARPIYMCARGETGIPLQDVHGVPLTTPIGHRRTEMQPLPIGVANPELRRRMRTNVARADSRQVTAKLAENPYRAGTKAAAHFDMMAVGMTIDTMVQSGVPRDAIRWAIHKKHISVSVLR